MASEEILLKYKADITDLQAKVAAIEVQVKKTDTAFKESQERIQKGTKKTAEGMDELSKSLGEAAKLVGIAFTADKIVEFGKESVKAFAEAQAALKKLEFSLKATTGTGQAGLQKLIEQSEELAKVTFFEPSKIQQAQAAAAAFGLNADEIERLIPATADLAVLLGTDLKSALDIQLRAIEGQTRGLKVVGQDFKATGDRAKNFELLLQASAKGAGQAAAALNTVDGAIKNMEKNFQEAKEAVGGFLIGLVTGFKDANTETFKSAKANQDAATSSQKLLAEYEKLTSKGIKPTKEEKERLTTITYQLRTALGDSVVAIDKETGALVLNKDAVKEAIKQKLLLANQEASTLALRVNALSEEKEQAELQKKSIELERENLISRGKSLGLTLEELQHLDLSAAKNKEQLDILQQLDNLSVKSANTKIKLNDVDKERVDLLEKLKQLGFDEAAVQKLFNDEAARSAESRLGKTQEALDAEAAANKKFLEDQAALREQIAKAQADAARKAIDDEFEARRQAERDGFADNVKIVEDGVKKELIARGEGAQEIFKFEASLNEALAKIDEDEQKTKFKKQQDANKEAAEKAFNLFLAQLDQQNAEEARKENEAFAAQADHSEKAEAEHQQRLLDIDLKFLKVRLAANEDDPIERAKILKQIEDIESKKVEIVSNSADKQREINKKLFQDIEEGLNALADSLSTINNNIAQGSIDALNAQEEAQNEHFDREQERIEDQAKKRIITEAQAENQSAELKKKRAASEKASNDAVNALKRKQAETDKLLSIFRIGLILAEALADLNLIKAGIAALELATVISTPIPKFFKGTKSVERGLNPAGQDTVPAWLHVGERVVTEEKNKKHWDVYEALDENRFDRYVHKHFVVPKLKEQQRVFEESKRASFAESVGRSVDFAPFIERMYHDNDYLRRKGTKIVNTKQMSQEIGEVVAKEVVRAMIREGGR